MADGPNGQESLEENSSPEPAHLGPAGFTAAQVEEIDAVVSQLPIAAVVHSLDSVIIAANAECRAVLGYDVGDLTGAQVAEFIPETNRDSAHALAAEIAASPLDSSGRSAPVQALRQLRRKDGVIVSCWMHVGAGMLAGRRVIIVIMDLVNPVVHDAHLWRSRAERDDLTGLYRRSAFLDRINGWIVDDRILTLAFIDVDNLKLVNDTHSHAAGDRLLEAVAHRIVNWLPDGAVAGRFAGDEFVLALCESTDSCEADALCAQLGEEVCREPVPWDGELLALSVSIGAVTRTAGEDGAALIARADEKMYIAKTQSRERIERASP